MSEKINLTDVKVWIAQNGSHPELLALVAAVEAAKTLRDAEAHIPGGSPGDAEWRVLDAALRKFEFGQDR